MKTHVCSKCGKEKALKDFSGRWSKRSKKYYYSWCKECAAKWHREYYSKPENRKKRLERQVKYRKKNREKIKQARLKWYRKMREDVFRAYGGKNPKCACCEESEMKFLAIDHINGGGNKDRRENKKQGLGGSFYLWLKRNNYPKGFQVLCHNCNMAKGFYGKCPHEVK